MKNTISLMLLFLFLISASSVKQSTFKKKIVGVWLFGECSSTETLTCLNKVSKFDNDQAGIQFKKNGKLVKRQNSGRCGTPPISYGNYNGTWKATGESTLTITYAFFGGTMEEDWKIIETSDKKLKISVLDSRTKMKIPLSKLQN